MTTTKQEIFDTEFVRLLEQLRDLSVQHGFQLIAAGSCPKDEENSDVVLMLDVDSTRGLVPPHFRVAAEILQEKTPPSLSSLPAFVLKGADLPGGLAEMLAKVISESAPPECQCVLCVARRADNPAHPGSDTKH